MSAGVEMSEDSRVHTLAIDVGGSHLKAGIVDGRGKLEGDEARIATPAPATPAAVVAALIGLTASLAAFDRVSVGFPGFVRAGIVLSAPNLDGAWPGFALSAELARRLGKPTRMLNDATVQGLGVIKGQGVELVLTLGTGVGFALFHHGLVAPHLEMSQHPIRRRKTYDEYLGHEALRKVGKKKWGKRVRRVVAVLETVVRYDALYLGGGDSELLTPPLPPRAEIVSNKAGITGGVRLWEKRMDPAFATDAAPFTLADPI